MEGKPNRTWNLKIPSAHRAYRTRYDLVPSPSHWLLPRDNIEKVTYVSMDARLVPRFKR